MCLSLWENYSATVNGVKYWWSGAPHQKPWAGMTMPPPSLLPPAGTLRLSFAVSSLRSCSRRRRRITVSAQSCPGWGAAPDPHPAAPISGLQAGTPVLSCEEPWGRIPPGFGILHERIPGSWGAALPAQGRVGEGGCLPVPVMGVRGGLTLWGGGTAGVGQGAQTQWGTLLHAGVGRGMGSWGLATCPCVRGNSRSDSPSFPH